MAIRGLTVAITLACASLAVGPRAYADPQDTSARLRDGNAAATAGDWQQVDTLVQPLLAQPLGASHRAEAHRLAGLAAFYLQRQADADRYFFEYLKLEAEGQLDPTLYPPEVVNFFNEVKRRHSIELRSLHRPKKHMALNLLPPAGQFQNGEPTKGIVIASLLGAFAITNVTSYFVLRSWCTEVSRSATTALCDGRTDHTSSASTLRGVNIASGILLIATYAYGVYDGVSTYRRREREFPQPFVTPMTGGGVAGLIWGF